MINNHIKGKEYEIQTRDHIINVLNKKAYLWEDVPETILVNAGIIGSHNINRLIRKEKKENSLMDTGIDVIQVNEDDSVSLIQCKNGYKNGITMHDLSGFMCWMTVLDKLNGYVYYTDKISNITFKERLWYWVNNINKEILCKCGNKKTFNKNWLDGYRKYCSP